MDFWVFEARCCKVMIIREIIGRAFLLMRKARDRCVSDYLYTAVNAKGGGFITANTTLLHPEHIFLESGLTSMAA